MKNNKVFGKFGEDLVVQMLLKQGFKIKARNYNKLCGEIDIIAQKGEVLSFVEVKSRINPLFDMTCLISPTKQKKIVNTAKYYCSEHDIRNMICRFDVALVTQNEIKISQVTIIENAFTESIV